MSIRMDALRAACQEFERALASTKTQAEAEAQRSLACSRIERSCHSDVVRQLLERHASRLIHDRYLPRPQPRRGTEWERMRTLSA